MYRHFSENNSVLRSIRQAAYRLSTTKAIERSLAFARLVAANAKDRPFTSMNLRQLI